MGTNKYKRREWALTDEELSYMDDSRLYHGRLVWIIDRLIEGHYNEHGDGTLDEDQE